MMQRFVLTEADGTWGRWQAGKVYGLQDLLELCWMRQQYIDEWKRVSGLDHSPWVVFKYPDWWPN